MKERQVRSRHAPLRFVRSFRMACGNMYDEFLEGRRERASVQECQYIGRGKEYEQVSSWFAE